MLIKIALRNLGANKLRLALTTLAVTLGVSIVAGTLIFSATINTAMTDVFSQSGKGVDTVVRPHKPFSSDPSMALDLGGTKPLPAELLAELRQVDDVEKAHGAVMGYASALDKRGKVIGANQIGQDWTDDSDFSLMRLTSGRGPKAGDEVAMDADSAKEAGVKVGDKVEVVTRDPAESYTLVGIFGFGDSNPAGGTAYTAFAPATAQLLLAESPGTYNQIDLHARDGVSQERLRDAVAEKLTKGTEAITGRQAIKEQIDEAKDLIGLLSTFLLAFAVIAVFVGSFIIFNTFSMLVAQRTRDLAMLRAVGASRKQVSRSVLSEAAAVGAVGATLGIVFGCGLAVGLRLLISLFGQELPTAPLTVPRSAVAWSYAVGVLVTVVAAYLPARRAATIPPVTAMRDDFGSGERSLRVRNVTGSGATALGAGVAVGSLTAKGTLALTLAGGGSITALLGITMLMPAVSKPMTALLGWPFARIGGAVGRLSRLNARSNPRRTATTASALMIGLALIAVVSVISASTVSSVNENVDEAVRADYRITAQGSLPFSVDVDAVVAKTPGVTKAIATRSAQLKIDGSVRKATSGDPAALAELYDFDNEGTTALGTDDLLVSRDTADANGWQIGDTAPGQYEDGATTTFRIAGIYADIEKSGDNVPAVILSAAGHRAHQQGDLVDRIDVLAGPGSAGAKDRDALESALSGWPNLQVQDREELKKQAAGNATMLLPLILVLLALSVIIAALGIVNTLALSVIERAREIGLLRAIGLQRGQLRRMIRYEAVVISAFGTVLGLAAGVICGWVVCRAMADEGVEVLTVPFGQLGIYLLVGALIGAVAAVLPARRAARMDVLTAIGGR